MSRSLISTFFVLLLAQLLGFHAAHAATIGPCHPYPGAVATDCLTLVANNLNSDDVVACQNQRATLTLGNCSIVTKCNPGQASVEVTEVVRWSLTAIGSCALNDRGSISGYYIADSGEKTCYLYPGQEGQC